MPKFLDLTDKTFGDLKVLSRAPNKGKNVYWTCQCKCGTIKEIRSSSLTSGITTSCGHCKNPNISITKKKKKCPICNKIFETNINNRKYCYECSPSKDSGKFRKRAIKHQLILYKGNKCEICGYDKCEGALEFHHLNPEEKDFQIADIDLSKNLNMDSLKKEVDKCQLVCANCHREIHYLQ